jgi:cytochrome b subunit of formate dehydrogenase
MKSARYAPLIEKTIRWLLLIVIILYFVTGYGITEFRIVERLTFGLLTKPLAFKIHDALWIPFITLLILHIVLPSILRRFRLKER